MKTSKQRQEDLKRLTDDAQSKKMKAKLKIFLDEELDKQFDYEDALFCKTGQTLSGYYVRMDDFLLNYPNDITPTILSLVKDMLNQNGYKVLSVDETRDLPKIVRIQKEYNIKNFRYYYPIYFVHALDGEE